jgi:hypothetical protein
MLTAELNVDPAADTVEFALVVENAGDENETLNFRDGRRADFAAYRDGSEVWRWSDGRMFAQALGSETLAPGERVTYRGTWDAPESGSYVAIGTLAAVDRTVDADAEFLIP